MKIKTYPVVKFTTLLQSFSDAQQGLMLDIARFMVEDCGYNNMFTYKQFLHFMSGDLRDLFDEEYITPQQLAIGKRALDKLSKIDNVKYIYFE